MKPPRPTRNVLQVYAAMLQDATERHYALELSKSAKISIGTIYAVMARLEESGVVTSQIEEVSPSLAGRPPRRYYTFTADGLREARHALTELQRSFPVGGFQHA